MSLRDIPLRSRSSGGLPEELSWDRFEGYWERWPGAVLQRRAEVSYRIGPILARLALGAEPEALSARLRGELERLGPAQNSYSAQEGTIARAI